MRLLLSGDEASEREEREADVAGDAELAGRLEGIRDQERGKLGEEDMGTWWDGRAETRKGKQEGYKGIDSCRRSCPVLSPTVK